MNFILTLLILMIILGVIITIHEFGHFITAKKDIQIILMNFQLVWVH